MEKDQCLRCGQCCFMPDSLGSITTEPCKYMIFEAAGKTSCRIYENRLGTRLSHNTVCGLRCKDRFDYEHCPYNDGKKPLYSVSRERVRRIFWR